MPLGPDLPIASESAEARRHRELIAQAREQARSAVAGDWAAADEPSSDDAPHPPPLDIPADSLPGYQLLHPIHRGGQGVVYQAIQRATRRRVAVKVMREGPFADDRDRVCFEREVRILAQLNHPNIVTIHDSGSASGRFFFAMDYISGQTLDVYMASVERPVREAMALFATICDAVNAAHLKGIIHRDLKPRNILVGADGQPRILDFGLAKVAAEALGDATVPRAQTVTGQFVGSLPWASPEQATGQSGAIDVRTDVYALGVVLYQMLTGRFPYDVTGPMPDVVGRIRAAEPVPPRRVRRSIDDEAQTIVLKCLSKSPDRRYQTAGELGRDVRHYLAGEAIEAKRDSTLYVLRKRLARHKLGAGAAAGAAVLLVGWSITSAVLWRGAEAAREEASAVAEFQAGMLTGLEAEKMGLGLLASIREEAAAAMEARHEPPEEIASKLATLDTLLADANATNVAVRNLDENVLRRAEEAIHTQFADRPVVRAALLHTVAGALRDIGVYERAVSVQEVALRIRRRELGNRHPRTLESIGEMGFLLFQQGRLAEAEPYFSEHLEGSRRTLGADHPNTLVAMSTMATLRQAQGRLPEAEAYGRETLAARRRVLGADDADTLVSVNNMASLLMAQGRAKEAEPYCREALEGTRRVLGEDHPRTFKALNNLGAVLGSMGRVDESQRCYLEALEGSRRVLGDDHPDTLFQVGNVGRLLRQRGRLVEAEPYHRQAMEGFRRTVGDAHPDTIASVGHMGVLLRDQGRLTEAESYLREALDTSERTLGPDHPETMTALAGMGGLLYQQGRLPEAEAYSRRALEGRRRLLGNDHRRTLESVQFAGVLLRDQGKPGEAEPYLREAMDTSRRTQGAEHQRTLSAIDSMGVLRRSQGRLVEAEQHLREAMDARRRTLGEEHPDTLASMLHLGSLLTEQGRFTEAEPLLRTAAGAADGTLPPTHADRRALHAALVALYDARDAAEPGKGYAEKAAASRAALEQLPRPDSAANSPEPSQQVEAPAGLG